MFTCCTAWSYCSKRIKHDSCLLFAINFIFQIFILIFQADLFSDGTFKDILQGINFVNVKFCLYHSRIPKNCYMEVQTKPYRTAKLNFKSKLSKLMQNVEVIIETIAVLQVSQSNFKAWQQ